MVEARRARVSSDMSNQTLNRSGSARIVKAEDVTDSIPRVGNVEAALTGRRGRLEEHVGPKQGGRGIAGPSGVCSWPVEAATAPVVECERAEDAR
jgi:hypothetical protein